MKSLLVNYDIRPYHPDLLNQVVECLSPLWGNNFQVNLSTFKWKHVENPYVEEPLGTVAMHQGRVVGFRGFFATRWQIPAKHYQFTLLSPGDICVHPQHRGSGLAMAMFPFAMREYQSKYKVFLATSASKSYLTSAVMNLGFAPLTTRPYLKRRDWLNLLWRKSFWSKERRADFYVRNLEYGLFGQVLVERDVRPDIMAAIVAKQNPNSNKISLLQDLTFYRWRFNNCAKRYVFYYFKEGDSIRAYLVVSVSQHPSLGVIVDYAEEPGINALETILFHIIRQGHFGSLSTIPTQTPTVNILHRLHRLKFRSDPVVMRRWRGKVDLPFFVRPVREECHESDWFLEGMDIRNPENWEIKGISDDGV